MVSGECSEDSWTHTSDQIYIPAAPQCSSPSPDRLPPPPLLSPLFLLTQSVSSQSWHSVSNQMYFLITLLILCLPTSAQSQRNTPWLCHMCTLFKMWTKVLRLEGKVRRTQMQKIGLKAGILYFQNQARQTKSKRGKAKHKVTQNINPSNNVKNLTMTDRKTRT